MPSARDSAAAGAIKNAVSVREFLTLNGFSVNRHGFCVCPLHGDHDASLKVYDNGRGWTCYGCHKGGDVINLAMDLYGIGFKDAISRLNEEFSLGLQLDRKMDPREALQISLNAARAKSKRIHEQESEAALERKYWRAFDRWNLFDALVIMMEDSAPDTPYPPGFSYALEKRQEAYENLMIFEERRIKVNV